MRFAMLSTGALLGSVLVAVPAHATPGAPAPDGAGGIFRSAEWVKGQVGFNQAYTGFPLYPYMTYAMSGVDVPAQPLSAGQVFYVHVWAGLPWPQSATDTAIPQLGLPEGLSVVPAGTAPTYCYITVREYVPTRDPGCAVFPSGASGAAINLGTYPLTAGLPDGSESVSIFVPVVASGPIADQKVFVSTRMLQSPSTIPNPLYGDAPLSVAAGTGGGSGGGTTPGTTPGAIVTPSGQKFTWKNSKALVRWSPVTGATSYRARLKAGKKWSKWTTLATNGLRLGRLTEGKRYTLQVQAVGDAGPGPVASWRFRAK